MAGTSPALTRRVDQAHRNALQAGCGHSKRGVAARRFSPDDQASKDAARAADTHQMYFFVFLSKVDSLGVLKFTYFATKMP
jgi:hypothetical protein